MCEKLYVTVVWRTEFSLVVSGQNEDPLGNRWVDSLGSKFQILYLCPASCIHFHKFKKSVLSKFTDTSSSEP